MQSGKVLQYILGDVTEFFAYSLFYMPFRRECPLKVLIKFYQSSFEPRVAAVNFIKPGNLANTREISLIAWGASVKDSVTTEYKSNSNYS